MLSTGMTTGTGQHDGADYDSDQRVFGDRRDR